MVQSLWKTAWRVLKKLNRLDIWSSNVTSGYIHKRIESRDSNILVCQMFIAVVFPIANR